RRGERRRLAGVDGALGRGRLHGDRVVDGQRRGRGGDRTARVGEDRPVQGAVLAAARGEGQRGTGCARDVRVGLAAVAADLPFDHVPGRAVARKRAEGGEGCRLTGGERIAL